MNECLNYTSTATTRNIEQQDEFLAELEFWLYF